MSKNDYKPIFVLGVGAQKAGTSWLYSQLQKKREVNLGFTKEYHVWDAINVDHCRRFAAPVTKGESGSQALRRMMQNVDGVYEKYFEGVVGDGVFVTGDITPSYSTLTDKEFSEIRGRLKGIGFDVKVVFLMRDPVERNWSAARMMRDRFIKKGGEVSDSEFVEYFKELYKSNEMVHRTRYDLTVENLKRSFSSNEIFLGFYEKLFEQRTLQQLSEFLGFGLGEADVGTKVNSSSEAFLPAEEEQECKEFFQRVYEYCYRNFSITKDLWR